MAPSGTAGPRCAILEPRRTPTILDVCLATLQDDAVGSNPDFHLRLALLQLDYEPVAGRRFHELSIIDLPGRIGSIDLSQDGSRKFALADIPLGAQPLIVPAEIHVLATSIVDDFHLDLSVIIF